LVTKVFSPSRFSLTRAYARASPGVRVGSPAYRVFREEAYQGLRLQLQDMRYQLRDYNEKKRRQIEKMKKEMMSATAPPERRADSA